MTLENQRNLPQNGFCQGAAELFTKGLLPRLGQRKSAEVMLLIFVTRKQGVLSLYGGYWIEPDLSHSPQKCLNSDQFPKSQQTNCWANYLTIQHVRYPLARATTICVLSKRLRSPGNTSAGLASLGEVLCHAGLRLSKPAARQAFVVGSNITSSAT